MTNVMEAATTLAEQNARLAEENALLRQRCEYERLARENALLKAQLQQESLWPMPTGAFRPPPGLHTPKISSCGNFSKCASFNSRYSLQSTLLPSSCGDSELSSVGSVAEESLSSTASESNEDERHTTRILQNLPNRYTWPMLLKLIDSNGFNGKYNLVYIPIDFKTGANMGYAFVNFVNVEDAATFTNHFQGFCSWEHNSEKRCQVACSEGLQGLEAFVERYRNSPVMHESMPDEFKPVLFSDGVRVPFPPPTRKIRKPRQVSLKR